MARGKNGARKPGELNPAVEQKLNGGDETAVARIDPGHPNWLPAVTNDIALIGFYSDGTGTGDTFAFVILADISGETINFTDNGWLSGGGFRPGEGTVSYTVPANTPIGTVVTLNSPASGFSLATGGDSIIAYTGSAASPTAILFALDFANTQGWDATAADSNTSAVPTGLTNGVNALSFALDNGAYTGPVTGTRAGILANIANASNWTLNDTTAVTYSGNFTVQSQTLSIDDVTHVEGNTGTTTYTFTVTRSGGSAGAVSVNWGVTFPGGAGSADAADLTGATSGTVNFASGETSKTITVTVAGDTTFEPTETFNIALSNATGGATISDATGVGTITNDDPEPQPGTLGIDDVIHAEGDSGTTLYTFTVTRTGGSDGAVSATWTLNAPGGGSYADSGDFAGGQVATGTVSFADGQTTATIQILVQGDTVSEEDEDFTVTLSVPTGGATIGDDSGTGLIQNDDSPPADTPPAGADNSVIGTEDTPYVFTLADFPYTDADGDTLTHVYIATLPAAGTLYVNGIAVQAGETVAAQDIVDGVFTYVPGPDGNGQGYASFTFQVVVTGGVLDPTPNILTIDLTPVPDPADIGGTDTGTVTEDGTTAASGALTVSDPDGSGEESFQTQTGAATAYGTFSIDAAGNWSYQLDNGNAAVQALNDGDTLTDTIQVLAADGTAHAVVITVNGATEPVPPITLDLDTSQAGIDYAGAFTEQGAASAIGNAAHIVTQSGTVSSLIIQLTDGTVGDQLTFDAGLVPGGFIVNASATQIAIFGIGSAAAYEAILASVRYTNGTDNPTLNGNTDRVISVVASDHVSGQSSATAYATIAVTAVNDLPTLGGQAAGDIYEDATFSTSGQLTISDPDQDEARFQAQSVSGTYGSFNISQSGAWTYSANSNQFMRGGHDYVDTFRVWSFDNSSYVDLVVTSHGNDDAPNIFISGGNTVGYVFEDGSLEDGHVVPINDVDENENGWVAGDFAAAYGTFHIEQNGTWLYTLNNNAPALLTLNSGQTVTDTHQLTSLGGNVITLQVQVNGANEPPGPPIVLNPIADTHVLEDNAVNYQLPANTFFDPDNAITYSAALAGGGALPGWLSFDAGTLTFSGTPPLNFNGTLSIRVTASDGSGSAFDDFDLVIDPVNDAPTITGIQGDAITYVENSGLVLLDLGANAVLTDPDSGNFAGGSLTVGIYENYTGSESITPFTGGAVTPSSGNVLVNGINIGTGGSAGMYYVVNFNANATAALVQILLRSFGYRNNGENPPTATKSFAWTLVDGDGTANGGTDTVVVTSTLTITSVNDAPTGTDKAVTLLEDGSYTIATADFGFADVENNGFAGAVITTVPGAGTLTLNGVAVTAGTFVTAADIAAGKLVFTPAANGSGNAYASLTFQVRDAGGTANGGVDTDQSPNTLTFNVTGINDAPVVNNVQGDAAIYIEGSAPVPLNLGADALIVDDNANFNGGSLTVGIDDATYFPPQDRLTPFTGAVTSGSGVLVNGVNIGTFGSGGRFFVINFNANATAERVQILLNSIAYNNSAGDNPIAGRRDIVWTLVDGGGTANGGQDTITFTTSITVGAINDAPSGSDAAVTLDEDGSHVFTAADFAYTDPENNGFAGVVITTLPGAGTLTLNGNSVAAGTFVTAAELAAGALVFTPAQDANGAGYASFTFQVRDNAGTADGGQDTDQSPNTLTLNVNALNDAPVAVVDLGVNDTTLEQTALDLKGTMSVADVDAGSGTLTITLTVTDGVIVATEGDSFVTIVSGNNSDTLVVSGTLAQLNAFLNTSANSTLLYLPTGDTPPPSATLTLTVDDGGNSGSGGPLTGGDSQTIFITPVNDAPTSTTPAPVGVDPNLSRNVGGMTFADVDGNGFLGVYITGIDPGVQLKYYPNGTSQPAVMVGGGTFIAAADIGTLLVSFAANYTNFGPSYGFSYQVADDGGTANGGQNRSISYRQEIFVDDGNSAPFNGVPGAQSFNEDNILVFSNATGNQIYVTDSDANGADLTVTLTIEDGTLTLATVAGLTSVTGNGTNQVVLTGSQSGIIAALDGLAYAPPPDANGERTLTITTNDNGNTGTGGPQTDTDTVAITINAVNDAPTATITPPPPSSVPVGDEFQVNTLVNLDQVSPGIAARGDGGYVVTWQTYDPFNNDYGIFAQRYDADGAALGGQVRVNGTTPFNFIVSSVAGLSGGGYVVSWQFYDNNGTGIFAQSYDANGNTQGGPVTVNSATVGDQTAPFVLGLSDGGYVILWQSAGVNPGIHAQRYDADGSAHGGEVLLGADSGHVWAGALAGGGYLVVMDDGMDIFVRRFDADGVQQGSDVPIDGAAGILQNVTAAMLGDGGYAFAWQAGDADGLGIYAQRFDADGDAMGGAVRVNSYILNQQINPSVTALNDGGYLITWQSNGQDGSGYGIYAQRFDASGTAIGPEMQINSTMTGQQSDPAVVTLSDGTQVVVWQSPDGATSGIYARHLGTEPGGFFATEQTPLSLKGWLGVADIDSFNGETTITLSVGHGIITVTGGNSGVDIIGGNGTGSVTISGALGEIMIFLGNQSTSTIDYTPTGDAPPASTTLTLTVDDNGNSGLGGAQTGSDSETITIISVDDAPTSGANTGVTVAEGAAIAITSADLDFDDPDTADAEIVYTLLAGPYQGVLRLGSTVLGEGGTFTQADINAGNVTFTHDGSETASDLFLFSVSDGTNTVGGQTFAISVTPVNDAAVITGDATGNVIEAGGIANATGGVRVAVGDLNSTDVDNPADLWQADLRATTYGSFTVDASGHWTFTLDDNNPAVQALRAGEPLTDSFVVYTEDNTAQTVIINITGANDAPANVLPGPITGDEDRPINLNGVSIGDVDGLPGDTYTVTLSVAHGTLTIRTDVAGGITGANIVGGGNGTNGLTITGTLAQINTTLGTANALTYLGDPNYNGSDGLRVATWEDVPADATSFAAPLTSAALTNATSLVTGDLNGDGKLDLVYIGDVSHQIGVRLGNGDGTFAATTAVTAGANPSEVILVDIDNDGDRDLVSTDYAGGGSSFGSVGVNLNNGSGLFGAYQSLGSIQSPFDVQAADLNGDGRVDLVAARRDYGMVSVLLASGPAGSFAAPVHYSTSAVNLATGVILGDFNGDGRADIVSINFGNRTTGNAPGSVSLLLNLGNGTFGAPSEISTGTTRPLDGTTADLNNDGNLDLIVASYAGNNGLTVMLGNGNGTFGAGTFYGTAGDGVNVTVGDVNGDGIADLITGNGAGATVAVFIGNGNGTFQSRVDLGIGTTSYAETTAAGDFDGDGDLDIAVNRGTNTGQAVLLNTNASLGDTDTVAITLNPVNDAPSGTDATRTILEDGSYTFTVADFGFSDAVEGNGFFEVIITTLPASGTLRLGATTVTTGQHINVADIPLLTFTPAPNANGAGYGNFTFQVRDNGGTANSGTDTDQSANLFTINVTPVNDAPTLANLNGDTVTFTEGDPEVRIDLGLNADLNDIDSTDFAGGTMTVAITGGLASEGLSFAVGGNIHASFGTVYFGQPFPFGLAVGTFAGGDGVGGLSFTFNGNATPEIIELIIQRLTYYNGSEDPAAGPRTITVTINDGDGTANGGASTVVATTTVNIVPVNDEPILTATAVNPTFTENGAPADLFSGVTASTVEAGQTITSMTLTVSGLVDGSNEQLSIDGSFLALVNGNSVVTATNGLTVTISVSGGTATVNAFGAPLSAAAFATLVDSLGYRNLGDNPTGGNRVVTITQVTDSGAGGGADDNVAMPNLVSTVNVDPVNDGPVLSGLDGTPTYTEDGPFVVLDGNVTVLDTELAASGNYAGATLTVSRAGGANADDRYDLVGGSVSYSGSEILGEIISSIGAQHTIANATRNNGVFTVTFNASATQADVNAVLQALAYQNVNANPSGPITLNYVFTDGNSGGAQGSGGVGTATGSVTVAIQNVNDAPSLDQTKSPVLTTVNEDAGVPVGAVGTLVSSIVDFASAPGGLDNVGDIDTGAVLGISITGVGTAFGTLYYSTNNGASWTAVGAVSDASALLLAADGSTRLYFQPLPNLNGTLVDALTFRAWDQTTGTAGTLADASVNGGTTAFSLDFDTVSLQVNAVNDAPVLDASKSPVLVTVNEDPGLPAGAVGTLVSSLVDLTPPGNGLANVTDADGGTLLGIAITGIAAGGTLYYSTNGGANWTQLVSASDSSALLLAADPNTRIYFVPGANFNGTVANAITFRAWDQTSGTAGSLANVTVNGGTTAFSSATDTAALTVNSVNDAPSGTDASFTINEDAGYSFTAASFGFSDAIDGNAFAGVVITTVPVPGALLFDADGPGGAAATAVTAGQFISAADIALGRLTFNPAADANGTPFSSFTFQVRDNGGTANGGVDTDQSANTITFNVTAVNDAPTIAAPVSILMAEDNAQVFSGAAAISVADVDASTLTVTLTVTHGTLSLAGVAGLSFGAGDGSGDVTMTFTGTASAINTALNGLAYNPTANYNGSDAISIQVTDNGQTGTGGAQVGSRSIAITLSPVNDAPQGTNNTLTGSEDDPVVFTAADFGFGDPVDGGANSLLSVRVASLPSVGTLYLDADGPGGTAPVAVVAGQYISAADIAAGHFYYLGAADGFGSPYASFTFQVQDNGGTVGSGVDLDQSPNTLTINLTPDNLPPVVDLNGAGAGINNTVTFIEDGSPVSIGLSLTVSDPDEGLGDRIESATITLTDRVAGDSLTYPTLPPGFTAVTTSNATTYTVQIFGTGTGAQYQAILSGITYSTTNQDPTVGGTDTSRTITVTVNDGMVDSAVATTTVNVTAVDDLPAAYADAFTINENGTISGGNLFANNGSGADSDPDGPALSISAVNGSGGNVGSQIALASGALLTVNANGTFSYNPNGAFLSTPTLGSGASNTPGHDSFTYTVAGGNTVTVSITLTGLDSHDTLLGTAGADILMGGNGNDTYYVENNNDQVIEIAGQGNDRVITSVSYLLANGTSVETLEAAAGTAGIALIGNEIGNNLIGNAGANILNGQGGADVMTGGLGNDTYYVDSASDSVVELAGEGFDSLFTSTSYALLAGSEVDWLSTISNSATTAINLVGNAFTQYLIGNNGVNILTGGGGADLMVGYAGNDTYIVTDAGAVAQEAVGGGFDSVYTNVSYVLQAGSEVEWLSTLSDAGTASINLTGNAFNNYLIGNAGANILDGGGGADTLIGYGGNDTYFVDAAGDVVSESAGNGFDSVYASVSYALAGGQEVEWLSTTNMNATDALNFTGNELANYLVGNAGANILDGKGGSDTLIGNAGADTFAFTTTLGAGNVDFILGFEHGVDKIALDDAIFTAIGGLGALNANAFVTGSAAADANDRIIYNSLTGQLFYDADGTGAGVAVQFATLSPGLTLTASDFTVI